MLAVHLSELPEIRQGESGKADNQERQGKCDRAEGRPATLRNPRREENEDEKQEKILTDFVT
jgi:hypothetical protein